MDLHHFRKLPQLQQDELLRETAVFLGEMTDQSDTFMLFQLDGFYLEIYCRNGEECSVNYFDEIELLEPYLEMIDISSIKVLLGFAE